MFETFTTFADASKMVDLIGRAPNGTDFDKICDMIKQIRVFVGFILQPEMELPKIVPDPRQ